MKVSLMQRTLFRRLQRFIQSKMATTLRSLDAITFAGQPLRPSDVISAWENNNTFLMTTLKGGRIFQLTLNENGTALAREPVELFRLENCYRDVAFNPDGRTIYVITDSFGPVQAINGGATEDLWNPSSVLVFRYEGNGSIIQS
jgi:hypothetical protein